MKIRPTSILALIALFIAIGGTATAASGLINGKKIKPGTVTGTAFKKGSITKGKISTSALAALAGAAGPKGEEGAKGEKGDPGVQGAPGVPGTRSLAVSATKVAQAPNATVTQAKLADLPTDRYVATAKVNVLSQSAGSIVSCSLKANGGSSTDTAEWSNSTNSGRGVLWMLNVTTSGADEVEVTCNAGISSATFRTTLTAVPAN